VTDEVLEMQEEPSAAQVAEIVGQVTADRVCGFNYRVGNYNNHCFVTFDSGQQLVIRFSRRGWEGGHWKIEKFAREACAAGILAEGTGLETPKTFIIDGSRSIVNAVYSVQSFVPGQVFKKVFKAARVDEQACLLRMYGAVASRIHAIKLPKCDYDETLF
jgi:hypothetical protein